LIVYLERNALLFDSLRGTDMYKTIKIGMVVVLAAIILTHWNAVTRANTEDGNPLSEMIVATYDADKLRVGENTEVLLVVQSNGEKANSTGILFAYTRSKGPDGSYSLWQDKLIGIPVKLGRGGMGKSKEGDGKTPIGLFNMNTPFGICAKKEGFPDNYLQVTDTMYWDGDVKSPTYNKLVDRNTNTNFNKKASEHLIDIMPDYNYALNIGYNPECKSGEGSALFLHCLGAEKGNTGGCVAIKEEYMIEILKLYKEGKTQMLIDNSGCFSKYY